MNQLLKQAIEVTVFTMVVVSPWLLGSVQPGAEFLLNCVLAILLVLWAIRLGFQGEIPSRPCLVTLALGGFFLFGVAQTASLPQSLLKGLSPATVELRQELLPDTPEILQGSEAPPAIPAARTGIISLVPQATRVEVLRLLGLFLLFSIVRTTLTLREDYRRFAIVCVANGVLLSLFAFIQFFSSRRPMAYWSIPLTVQPFGPFICRNHYPFYLNVCIALAMGLTLSLFRTRVEIQKAFRRRRQSSESAPQKQLDFSGWLDSLIELLQKPGLLWLVIALGFMISSVFFSLSRGGVACLILAAVLYFLFLMSQSREIGRWQLGVLAGTVTFLILFWFGFNIFESRLKTLWTGDGLEDSRWSIWADAFRIFRDFPLVGTGFGTYFFVELVHRTETGVNADMLAEFVHNDYLETLVEGGLVGMGLLLFVLFAVYRASWKALRHYRRRAISGVIIGGIFAITVIALHSFVDFGMRIPAIAVLVTVLAAYLSALGGAAGRKRGAPEADEDDDDLEAEGLHDEAAEEYMERAQHSSGRHRSSRSPHRESDKSGETTSSSTTKPDEEPEVPRFRSMPVWIALPLALLLGGILVVESLRTARGEYLERLGAEWLMARSGSIQGQKDRLAKLELALQVLPDDAIRQLKTSQAYFDLYRSEVEEWDEGEIALEATSLLFEGYVPSGKPICPLPLAGKLIQRKILGRKGATNSDPRWSTLREYLSQGMTHALAARNLAPTLGKPHLLIAANRDLLRSGDSRETYLARAKKVMPSSTELWYRAGVVEWQQQDRTAASSSWKRSLELSGEYLSDILGMIGGALSDEQLINDVLPANPTSLIRAAGLLYPQAEAEERRPYHEKALPILLDREGLTASEYQEKGYLESSLGRETDALESYRNALLRDPAQVAWRLTYAQLLYKQGMLRECRRELQLVLARQANNRQADDLLKKVVRELVEKQVEEEGKK